MADPNSAVTEVLKSSVVSFPSAFISMLAWLGHELVKDDPKMNAKRFAGGLILSGFVGWASCNVLLLTGLHAELAATLSSVIGASGMRGYEWLLVQAKASIGGKDDNGE